MGKGEKAAAQVGQSLKEVVAATVPDGDDHSLSFIFSMNRLLELMTMSFSGKCSSSSWRGVSTSD